MIKYYGDSQIFVETENRRLVYESAKDFAEQFPSGFTYKLDAL